MEMLAKDPEKQLVNYQVIPSVPQRNLPPYVLSRQTGIGTYTNDMFKMPIHEAAVKFTDKMFAHSLDDHVKGISFSSRLTISKCLTNTPAGYEYLMNNCQCTGLGPFTLLPCPIRSPRG